MEYNSCLFISTKDLEKYNKLLSIKDLQNSDYGTSDDFIQVGAYTYDNGITLYVDLCSGDDNYYLQYELVDNKQNCIECDILDDFEDFVIADSKDKYYIHFDLYEEEKEV